MDRVRDGGGAAGDEDWDPEAVAADAGVLRAVHGFKVAELERARAAALDVLELADEDSFPHTVARLILGVTLYWQGELSEAAERPSGRGERGRGGRQRPGPQLCPGLSRARRGRSRRDG